MTPRERMLATLSHHQPDRVPMSMDMRPELWTKMRAKYGCAENWEVAKVFDADIFRWVSVGVRHRQFEKKSGGNERLQIDERTHSDCWGVVQRTGSDGKYEEWVGGPFVNTDDLDSFEWPDDSDLTIAPDAAEKVKTLQNQGYWVIGSGGVHPFKQAWHMRGFENFLCDYMANPAWVEAIYERFLNYNIAICKVSAALGVDQIEYWGDVAMQDRMLVPPNQWRLLDKPMWKRLIAETRKVKPDIKFFFHSDGDTTPIIDDIIEVGFDILNPLQPECVNPGIIKQKWGHLITLDGGGSVQRTLPLGTVDDVRREVDFLMTTCAYNGGYILRPSNVTPYDTPLENVITFFEMARDYDTSKLVGPPSEIPQPPCMSIQTHGRIVKHRPD